jgi:hypothetical protein
MKQSLILDIVRRCQKDSGDRQAFDQFYQAVFPYVRLYVRALRLPTAPLAEEDIIQDMFLKLMERFPGVRFKNESHFLGYLKPSANTMSSTSSASMKSMPSRNLLKIWAYEI